MLSRVLTDASRAVNLTIAHQLGRLARRRRRRNSPGTLTNRTLVEAFTVRAIVFGTSEPSPHEAEKRRVIAPLRAVTGRICGAQYKQLRRDR